MVPITYECPNCHQHGSHTEGCPSYYEAESDERYQCDACDRVVSEDERRGGIRAGGEGTFCPECCGEKSASDTTDYSPAVQQAFRDWNDNRAYLDNGRNYRVRPEPATPTHRPTGKIAPWNREVKRLFADCGEFHRAAKEFEQRSEDQCQSR